ncbi:MAG TPA: hypothetical protein PLD27_04115 [bacterium]|nr:hypothetical protein [bacterium]HOL48064.1 hypothetical protein [bacterium]HPQ18001.1 hypothetical protein [bacterium]
MENKKDEHFLYKIIIFICVIVLVQLLLVILYSHNYLTKLTDKQVINFLPGLIALSNSSILLKEDFASLQSNVDNLVINFSHQFGIAYIIVLDLDKNAVVQSFSDELKSEDITRIIKISTDKELEFRFKKEIFLLVSKRKILDIGFPLKYNDENLGTLRIGYFKDSMYDAVFDFKKSIIFIAIVVLIIGSFVGIYLNHDLVSLINKTLEQRKNIIVKEARENILREIAEKEKKKAEGTIEALTNELLYNMIDSTTKMISVDNYEDFLKEVVQTCLKVFKTREVVFFLLTEDGSELRALIAYDRTGFISQEDTATIKVPVSEGDTGRAVQINSIILTDVPRPGYIMSVPISAYGSIIGALRLTGKSDGTGYNLNDRLVAKILTPIFGNLLTKYL